MQAPQRLPGAQAIDNSTTVARASIITCNGRIRSDPHCKHLREAAAIKMEESGFLHGQSHLLARLRQFFALVSIDDPQLKSLVSHSKLRRFSAGEPLVEEGTYDGWLFVLMSGRVKVLAHGAEIAEIQEPGEIFGEMAILEGRARSATVRAINETTCLVVDSAFIERLPKEQRNALSAALFNLMAERLAKRLRATNEELVKARLELAELRQQQTARPAVAPDDWEQWD